MNSVLAPRIFVLLIYSTTAQAIERPSKVLVPRPISSRIRRLFFVAFRRIFATSVISTMKVLDRRRSSSAHTGARHGRAETDSGSSAGTKLICAISVTGRAARRLCFDLPAMFGPRSKSGSSVVQCAPLATNISAAHHALPTTDDVRFDDDALSLICVSRGRNASPPPTETPAHPSSRSYGRHFRISVYLARDSSRTWRNRSYSRETSLYPRRREMISSQLLSTGRSIALCVCQVHITMK